MEKKICSWDISQDYKQIRNLKHFGVLGSSHGGADIYSQSPMYIHFGETSPSPEIFI